VRTTESTTHRSGVPQTAAGNEKQKRSHTKSDEQENSNKRAQASAPGRSKFETK